MKNWYYILLALVLVALAAFCLIYLHTILTYLLISGILSLMGYPFMKMLLRPRVGRWRMPRGMAAMLTILAFYGIVFGFVSLFMPLVVQELQMIASIDFAMLGDSLGDQLKRLDTIGREYNLATDEKTLSDLLKEELASFLNADSISATFSGLVGLLGNIFAAVFSISFITFFLLTDRNKLYNGIAGLIPISVREKFEHIVTTSQRLITRYFIGVLIQITLIIALVTIGMLVLDIRYALLLGFFAGIINIIPYLGPLIGSVFGCWWASAPPSKCKAWM